MKRKTAGFYLTLVVLLGCSSLLLAETGLRVLFREQLDDVVEPAESLFWMRDDNLGWTHRPQSSGEFSNGFFRGVVHIDEHGNRRNSAAGTFAPDNSTIAFIGDSTVASFEVDDRDTVPAILERRLRAQELQYNVINMGVRGYGTDQSVRKALGFAEQYQPTDVIYMFVDNDMYDNNVLRQPGRVFGKGAYVRSTEGNTFTVHNYPVPEYADDFAGLVVLDPHCAPVVHSVALSADDLRPSWSRRNRVVPSYTYRALKHLYTVMQPDNLDILAQIDPHPLITRAGVRWSFDFFHAYKVYGRVRARCGRYLEAQITFLLQQLRSMRSVQRVHVVHFPGDMVLRALRKQGTSTDSEFFTRLVREGVIDSYLDLPQAVLAEGVDTNALVCRRDPHFCQQGNEWIAAKILSEIRFDGLARASVRQ